MHRTQIYLTKSERMALNAIVEQTKRSQSQLIREAIDQFIEHFKSQNRKVILSRAAGLWAKRKDLPDFKKIRSELDRF